MYYHLLPYIHKSDQRFAVLDCGFIPSSLENHVRHSCRLWLQCCIISLVIALILTKDTKIATYILIIVIVLYNRRIFSCKNVIEV